MTVSPTTAGTGRTVTELSGPPALGPLYASAAAGAVLPGGGGGELPAREIVRRGITVDPGHLADYARVCGFRVGDALPVTYPHMLTFPLQVVLMAERSFPLALPGMVHVANRITVHRAVAPSETLDVRVYADRFTAHAKGAQVDLIGVVSAGGEVVWEGRSTYLARGAKAPAGAAGEDIAEPAAPTGTASALWRIPGDTGRRYAAVSGDVNPIHLHPLTTKAMGFPRAIAHGMWTAAHAAASLEGRIPDACTYDVVFRKPVLLPATAELVTERDANGAWGLAVRSAKKAEKLHLIGRISG
ncbi:dehydratase [Pseudonocardia sp. EC080610-09]|uniref:MaoC family dehydratase n=1 Tax=unclassified Pseudonocardia TaxID=2619320 RepID=UPI00070641DD|nr:MULTISPECIES: MaoC/PaaZ C-terminal domain-containing protein [unclassified Pseudonocardia]ALL75091.1 dehydratase [Pseudonocardia sp. EC080610-09]ALL82113.1 dehydratase [Pseudonocardia sp. EC080619-01]